MSSKALPRRILPETAAEPVVGYQSLSLERPRQL